MNFRECRQGTLLELIRYISKDVDARKAFLITGGMRNAYYVLKFRGVQLIGLSGCGETNVPGIFELLDMPYTVIGSKDFWDVFKKERKDNKNFYVLPVVRSMLNVENVDMDHYQLVGQSYFLVDHIEGDRMYLRTIDQNNLIVRTDEYFISKNVLMTCDNKGEWIKEADFEAYRINKDGLLKSKKLCELVKMSEKELLYKNIAEFTDDLKMVGDQETIRYDGKQVYDDIQKYLENIISYLKQVKGTPKYDNFKNFVYLQFVNFRRMVVAGTDGYYRSEFFEIIKDYEEFSGILKEWQTLIAQWRGFGRKLAMIETKKQFMVDGIEAYVLMIVDEWKRLSIKEYELILELQDLIEDSFECEDDDE